MKITGRMSKQAKWLWERLSDGHPVGAPTEQWLREHIADWDKEASGINKGGVYGGWNSAQSIRLVTGEEAQRRLDEVRSTRL